MKFIKKAFVFFGLVWCCFMVVSRILKKRKEDREAEEKKKEIKGD
jgi:large-conductance mechanosensitive channel